MIAWQLPPRFLMLWRFSLRRRAFGYGKSTTALTATARTCTAEGLLVVIRGRTSVIEQRCAAGLVVIF